MRELTEKRCKKYGIPVNSSLPIIDWGTMRPAHEVAVRINVLNVFMAVSSDVSSLAFFIDLLKEQEMVSHLSSNEKQTYDTRKITSQDEINFSWYQESIYALSFCIGIVNQIDLPTEEASLSEVMTNLPPEVDIRRFIAESSLINEQEIRQELDFYYMLHWAMRHPEKWSLWNKLKREKYQLSIIRERRRALEWVCDRNLEWDDISLNT